MGTSYYLFNTCCSVHRLATMRSVTDRRTDGQTDDIITSKACLYRLFSREKYSAGAVFRNGCDQLWR